MWKLVELSTLFSHKFRKSAGQNPSRRGKKKTVESRGAGEPMRGYNDPLWPASPWVCLSRAEARCSSAMVARPALSMGCGIIATESGRVRGQMEAVAMVYRRRRVFVAYTLTLRDRTPVGQIRDERWDTIRACRCSRQCREQATRCSSARALLFLFCRT